MRSEALQNYVKNNNAETYRQNMKNQKEASILQEKISNLEDMLTNLTQKNQAKDNQISNLEAKIIKTTQKNQTKDAMVSNLEDTIAKLIQKNQVKDAMINDLTIKNKKMRIKVQLFSELSQLVYKLNKKCQNAEAELIADPEEYKDI
jgi:chromosome segregation ATPase